VESVLAGVVVAVVVVVVAVVAVVVSSARSGSEATATSAVRPARSRSADVYFAGCMFIKSLGVEGGTGCSSRFGTVFKCISRQGSFEAAAVAVDGILEQAGICLGGNGIHRVEPKLFP
jgi:hypothetical protein